MTNVPPNPPTTDLTRDFTWGAVPSLPPEDLHVPGPGGGGAGGFTVFAAQVLPPLGPLAALERTTFRGFGFNTIFRPHQPGTPVDLPKPPQGPDDNVLELNLTAETLEFSSMIGSIPNRGFAQDDIRLNGLPYVQKINDVTLPHATTGVHFEPGVWLNVPATTAPAEASTVVRMASIPHGTTINAQGRSVELDGPPNIGKVDITPFGIGNPAGRVPFPSQKADDTATFRIPQDLTTLIADGEITQDRLDDPNEFLRSRIKAQNITHTTVVVVNTDPATPLLDDGIADTVPDGVDNDLFAGGTDNIAFLRGDKAGANPNADAVTMSAKFYIETVADQVTVPVALEPGESVTVTGTATGTGTAKDRDALAPTFALTATNAVAAGTVVPVTYTQVQYTQLVLLNFAPLSWPHVTVATLIPANDVPVTL